MVRVEKAPMNSTHSAFHIRPSCTPTVGVRPARTPTWRWVSAAPARVPGTCSGEEGGIGRVSGTDSRGWISVGSYRRSSHAASAPLARAFGPW